MTPRAPHSRFLASVALATVAALAACGGGEPAPASDSDASAAMSQASASEPGVVTITAKDFEFEAPAEIPSGWTTIRFTNEGEQEHFVNFNHLPDSVTFADYKTDVGLVFDEVWNRYDSGDLDRQGTLDALGAQLPGWFFGSITLEGGPNLTEPGETTQVTVRLDPGTYALECYVKTPQGTFHSSRGMLKELTVTAEDNGVQPPADADAELTLSNYNVAAPDSLSAGRHTIAVHVEENPEGMVMHDISLFRLSDTTSVDRIVKWMDWMDLEQFRAPAPGYSMGGMSDLVAGRTGYMTVDLTPGRYAWVSEGYGAQGVAKEFTVQ